MAEISTSEYAKIAAKVRGSIVEMSHKSKAAHLASALSCTDLLVCLFWKIMNIDPKNPDAMDKDQFILSKGHAAAAIYSVLAHRGYYPMESLDQYSKVGSQFCEHPPPKGVPGIQVATGSLGHGLPIGVGMALGAKLAKSPARFYVLVGDGECNEGTIWEAAMFASANKLNNLTVLVDYNKWQATGRSNSILHLEPLVEKWRSFGWRAVEINGHDHAGLINELEALKVDAGGPAVIVANTVKGKGVSFMEDDNNWHYAVPNVEQVAKAKAELGLT